MDICILDKGSFENSSEKNTFISQNLSTWMFFGNMDYFENGPKLRERLEKIISGNDPDAYVFFYENTDFCFDEMIQFREQRNADNNNAIHAKDSDKENGRKVINAFFDEYRSDISDGIQMLDCFDQEIAGILIKKSLLTKTGRFHEKITYGGNLEFLCRAADNGCVRKVQISKSFSKSLSDMSSDIETGFPAEFPTDDINDQPMNPVSDNEENKNAICRNMSGCLTELAYICCKYQTLDVDRSEYEKVLQHILTVLARENLVRDFAGELSRFVSDPELFDDWVRNTAPIYIITGDDTAYGVLKDFAINLADAFAAKGQALITTDSRFLPYEGIEDIEGKALKALIGFQAPVLFRDFFKAYNAPKLQFWFDDTVFFDDIFQQISGDDSYFILCQDGFHAEHLKKHYNIKNAVHFPPGGIKTQEPDLDNRQLDVVFIGTYTDPDSIRPAYYDGIQLHQDGLRFCHDDTQFYHGDTQSLMTDFSESRDAHDRIYVSEGHNTSEGHDVSAKHDISGRPEVQSESESRKASEKLYIPDKSDISEDEKISVGQYISADRDISEKQVKSEDFRTEYITYMLSHPDLTYEQGVEALLKMKNIHLPEEDFMKLLWSVPEAYRYVRACFRNAVIENLLSEGIKLNVYGESWESYNKKGKENLIIHPAVNPAESLEVLRQAKVSLNIMSWHKDGMTERITNTMLRGAVCVSDETKYLKEHFDKDSIILYKLTDTDLLPAMIRNILSDDDLRYRISKNAWRKAVDQDSWESKAEAILQTITTGS